jgi:dihydrofolate reductase
MGTVGTEFSMSLDGFVAGPNDGPENGLGDGGDRLFRWYFSGELNEEELSGDGTIKMNREGADLVRDAGQANGVLVTGRRTFDIAHAWGGRHPMDVPVIVVTHRIPQEWARKGSIFTFVTDGVESAIQKARDIAGDKNIAVGGPSIARQCLKAGLLDEIRIDLAPVLLGKGVHMFDYLGIEPVDLELVSVSTAPYVVHLIYRVLK